MADDEVERDRLHRACWGGELARVKELLAQGEPVNIFDDLGMTPLHYATKAGYREVMALLIAGGADVNAHDERVIGNTPLREVAGNCTYEVAELLIRAGADPTIPGWMQTSALHHARQRKRPEALRVKQLLEAAAANPGSIRKQPPRSRSS